MSRFENRRWLNRLLQAVEVILAIALLGVLAEIGLTLHAAHAAARPQPEGSAAASAHRLQIPAIGVDSLIYEGWDEESCQQLVRNMLGMTHMEGRGSRLPNELSGGQQQRVALARALASGSKVLLLDEPLRALDARLRLELRKELKSLAKSMGLTSIHVTHDQDEALEMADRIAVIRDGRFVQIGAPQEVFENPATPFVANFVGQSNFFVGNILCSRDGRMTTVEDDKGHVVFARSSDIPVDSKAVVAIKVGNTRVVKRSDAFVMGTVERTLFEGRVVHLDVNVGDLGRYSVKLPASRRDQVAVGDEVGLSWDIPKASVFPYPEGGLEEELRVD